MNRSSFLCAVLCGGLAWGQGAPPTPTAAHAQHASQAPSAAPTKKSAASSSAHHYQPDRFAGRAGTYYRAVWGVDELGVKWTESGEVIRFSYRVLDAGRAKMLNDGQNEASLIDPRAGVKLVVPAMENVGQLRQTAPPEGGKAYWVVFSNKGRLVKRGDRISVLIGAFHADGLVVD
jgi:hypothetical protein